MNFTTQNIRNIFDRVQHQPRVAIETGTHVCAASLDRVLSSTIMGDQLIIELQ